ncbi:hypothetical protein [Litchfieldia alkalitelluris]|uniref:hypothetical protein n=1 Tax=Litchfieldia alkalitelluris TaxID=304268 RepID=UPI000997D9D8|nr:hypothetical protein [Litchfieldia alkalitelluris]
MYSLLILIIIGLITFIIYLMLKKKNPLKFIIIIFAIIIGVLLLFGFRFTASSALPMGSNVIKSINTVYGKAVLYEDQNNTFGLAKINRSLGFLYHYSGGTSDYLIEGSEPFVAAGFGNDEEDGFMVGVKSNNHNINYIVVGNHLEDISPSDTYKFNMETVKKHPESYQVKEVVDQYAFFVFDEYSEKTWTIRALDFEGNLLADKLFGNGDARYIGW